MGTGDADILVSLGGKAPAHRRVHPRICATSSTREFPGTEFYYLPTDMVSQILNFGLPAQIDVQVVGPAGGSEPRIWPSR